MNTNYSQLHSESLHNRFGLRVGARLSAGVEELPHDVSERLRAARERALAQRRQPAAQLAARPTRASWRQGATLTLGFGDNGTSLWGRLASGAMMLALVAGLVAIDVVQDNDRATEVAELDAALLTDDLPPEAYADPGFLQFIKSDLSRTASTLNQ